MCAYIYVCVCMCVVCVWYGVCCVCGMCGVCVVCVYLCVVYVMNVCGMCGVCVWCVHVCGVYMCMCVCGVLSHVRLFVTPWTLADQAPLSMGFSRQEY